MQFHNEKLPCSPQYITTVIRPRKTKLVRHVSLKGVMRNAYKTIISKLEETDKLDDITVPDGIILK
jgi:hypothetical protein